MPALRHTLLFFFALLGLAQAQETPFHTFNLLDGRSINARIISADAETVTLERTDKLTFTLEQKVFDADDQARIQKWLTQDMQAKGTLIELTGKSVVQHLKVQREDGLLTYTWDCVVTVAFKNASPYPLYGLSLDTHWTLRPGSVARPKADDAPATAPTDNIHKESKLEAGLSVTQTSTIPLKATVLEEGWTWPGGGTDPVMDALSSIEATVTYGGKEIATISFPPAAPDFSKAQDKASTAPAEAEQ